MAKRGEPSGLSGFKLVNVYFNDKEKAEYGLWSAKLGLPGIADLIAMVEGGFKVSLSYDSRDSTYLCTLTGKETRDKRLVKKVFLIRHMDAEKVIGIARYFFIVLTDSGEQLPKDMTDDLAW